MSGGTRTSALSGRRKTSRAVRCGGGQEVRTGSEGDTAVVLRIGAERPGSPEPSDSS